VSRKAKEKARRVEEGRQVLASNRRSSYTLKSIDEPQTHTSTPFISLIEDQDDVEEIIQVCDLDSIVHDEHFSIFLMMTFSISG